MTGMTSRLSRSGKFHIVNLRGTNGSGKSYVVERLIRASNVKPIYGYPQKGKIVGRTVGHVGNFKGDPIYFIGAYEVMSGGCDALMKIANADYIDDLIRKYAGQGHIIFEGFMLTSNFQRYHDLSEELGGIDFCFMDTPLEVCLARIKRRNQMKDAKRGRIRKSMGTKWVEKKIMEGDRTRRKFKKFGNRTFLIDHKRPYRAICKILRS